MLVLSRKIGEKIVINKNVIITVVKLDGNKVRLGFEAPKEIAVLRSELFLSQECVPGSPPLCQSNTGGTNVIPKCPDALDQT
jgi:carbon storage regulator CsrA